MTCGPPGLHPDAEGGPSKPWHQAQERVLGPVTELLQPYRDELESPEPVTAGELGWRGLLAGATAGQRAQAETAWCPVEADRPCRCSGPCRHGSACEECESGQYLHLDRFPDSVRDVTAWSDGYQCNSCHGASSTSVTLPPLPWGCYPDGEGTREHVPQVFHGVRHPGAREG